MGLPWFKFHTSDALDDPLSRTARLSNRHLGMWLRVHARLLNCKPPGSGYTTEGAPITDRMWAEMVHERAREWSGFARRVVDELHIFGRDEAGIIYLPKPSKSIPAQDSTAKDRMRKMRELRRNEPVTPVTVTVTEPEPEPEPEPEQRERSLKGGREVGRATNPNAIQLAQMFCGRQSPQTEKDAGRVAERFQSVLEAEALTVAELNEAITGKRRLDEASWDMLKRIAPIDTGKNGQFETGGDRYDRIDGYIRDIPSTVEDEDDG